MSANGADNLHPADLDSLGLTLDDGTLASDLWCANTPVSAQEKWEGVTATNKEGSWCGSFSQALQVLKQLADRTDDKKAVSMDSHMGENVFFFNKIGTAVVDHSQYWLVTLQSLDFDMIVTEGKFCENDNLSSNLAPKAVQNAAGHPKTCYEHCVPPALAL